MKNILTLMLILSVVAVATISEPALAGPGGKIARAVFESFWGKVLLGALTIIFLPVIIYVLIKEKLAERRTKKDLRVMAGYSPLFEWLKIRERAKDCFLRVHSGWENEDLSDVSAWMTDWYWQNQQQVYLNKWRDNGLVNVCNVRRIIGIKPLLFVHRNHGAEHDGSLVVVSIEAHMQDYLEKRGTGEIVEGSKSFKDVETVWSFTLENKQWKVSDIEESEMTLAYANEVAGLPRIETTVVSDLRA